MAGQNGGLRLGPGRPKRRPARNKARSKRTGKPCWSLAVWGWAVCAMHDARGGALRGAPNGNYRTGRFTASGILADPRPQADQGPQMITEQH
jgi:hypothetical protein